MPTKILKTIQIPVRTTQRCEMVDITALIDERLRRGKVDDAVVIVYSPHTTAGVCINENADPDVRRDVVAKLDAMIPKSEGYYRHAEGNSDSHVKAILTGNSVTLFTDNGKLALGQWQGVYFCEFDGPRDRTVWVKIMHDRVHSNDND